MTFQILSNNNNISSIKITSDGIWQHENPLDFALPLLTVQISLILIVSRLISFVFTPLHQPNVVAEIMGGILLGPSALGRYEIYLNTIFPKWSSPVLNTISSIGLLLFMFLIGLELDLSAIRNSSHTSFLIAFAGILLPFLSSIPITLLLKTTINGLHETRFLPLCIFNGASLSITAFAVLARILSEMNILNTSLGETAMTAAALNDVVAWILLALAVALSGGKGETAPIESLWILLSGVAFVIFMLVFLRPLMARVTRGISLDNKATEGGLICLTLVGVLISGFTTDMLGIHSIFGAFIFGLTIPREGNFGNKLGEKMEILVSNLLLPLYFATSGLKTDVTKIRGLVAWGLVILVTIVAIVGKIFGSFVAGLVQKMKVRDALTIGVLMSTKGLVELIVLNIGREKKVTLKPLAISRVCVCCV
ncbi:hypothetical protein LUZ60_015310 [Juncus effusus]|nr:hypothetical protein LUZ60_015310 [Juncus effusus]